MSSSEPPLGEVIENPTAAELTLPLDSYRGTGEERALFRYAEDLVIGRCLAEQGVHTWEIYPPVTNPNDERANARRYGLISLEVAQEFGYIPPPPLPVEGLPPLGGNGLVANESFDPCLAEARAEVGTDRIAGSDQSLIQDLSAQASNSADADSRVRAVIAEWSACMSEAGYPDATDPFELSGTISARRPDAQHASAPGAPASAPQPSEEERAAAVADVTCKQEANLAGVWFAVESAYQARMVDENAGRLDGILARRRAAQDRAAEVIEQLGASEDGQG